MKNRTFVLWLTAGIMLLSAVARMFRPTDEPIAPKSEIQEIMLQSEKKETFLFPQEYTPVQAFGAIYDQELGQWTMQTQAVYSVDMNTTIYAPLSGQVNAIEEIEGGESCISLNCAGTTLKLFPIHDLSVLKGDWVEQGERLGRISSSLNVYAERDGQPIDPQVLTIETTFFAQSRSDKPE